ncbi:MAG TPA: toluene monooxygenase [Polyangiaceae bacterium]|nr:toluene monooxygenase [Polyangiaceae bacterium]
MLKRDQWLDLARKLDWDFSYVPEREAFPELLSGGPWLPREAWAGWDEPFRTSYAEYVSAQSEKHAAVFAVRDAVGRLDDFARLDPAWVNGLKLHAATLPLAEFAAVVGNLRGARFGRDAAWRTMSALGALDELRHTEIPLQIMHELVRWEPQFDWTHKFYHTNNWVAVAGKHLVDEMLLGSNAIEFAVATHFVFETGFTNLQFVALASVARDAGDRMFEKMLASIQTDEARHAQIGRAVVEVVARHDREYVQFLLDKWFWRSFLFFAVVTGFTMDYLTPVKQRARSFKEFMNEWLVDQYLRSVDELGLARPWYWDTFVEALDTYHHMVYASAYTYRATTWFNFAMPGPEERAWLRRKYPRHWPAFDAVWAQIAARWREADVGNEWAVHGTVMVSLCDTCQLVLCGGTPGRNTANVLEAGGRRYVFCSEPCRWIFERERERYGDHKNIVSRILAGEAPANLIALLQRYFDLWPDTWGKDVFGGDYPWLERPPKPGPAR